MVGPLYKSIEPIFKILFWLEIYQVLYIFDDLNEKFSKNSKIKDFGEDLAYVPAPASSSLLHYLKVQTQSHEHF